jgi:hypothetical protein
MIGLFNSIMVIKFINIAGSPGIRLPLEAAPAIGFSILIVPLFDTLRVFSLRILDKRSPFSPDRTHVHHFLLELGFSHKMVTFLCVGANIGFILLTFFIRNLGTTTVLSILFSIAISLVAIIYYNRPKKRMDAGANLLKEEKLAKKAKIFTLTAEIVEAD